MSFGREIFKNVPHSDYRIFKFQAQSGLCVFNRLYSYRSTGEQNYEFFHLMLIDFLCIYMQHTY